MALARLLYPLLLLALASTAAQAQVYRCAATGHYTDKPCHGAQAVDERANLLEAGPRLTLGGPPPAPAAAIIFPDPAAKAQPSKGVNSVWDGRAARDAEFRSRTGPYRR